MLVSQVVVLLSSPPDASLGLATAVIVEVTPVETGVCVDVSLACEVILGVATAKVDDNYSRAEWQIEAWRR